MPSKNIKTLLTQATSFPAAIEAKLPAGAPKVSTMLLNATAKIPAVPDFPIEIPDLPAPPEIPAMPAALGRGPVEYIRAVGITPMPARVTPTPTPQAVGGIIERRGF